MKSQKRRSISQLLTMGLLALFIMVAAAEAAPIYRGSFTLPYEAQWAQATLPAGDYTIRFQDVGSRTFVVVKEVKTGKEKAFLAAESTKEETGQSMLVVTNLGSRHIIHALRLAELGEIFVYEPERTREEAQKTYDTQTLPVVATK